jgi:putative ABC transport system permease protein
VRDVTAGDDDDAGIYEIVGVVRDYNYQTLHDEIYPMTMFNGSEAFVPATLAVRLRPGGVQQAIDDIRALWRARVPGQDLSYAFLDDNLDALYRSEQASGRIFNAFSVLAILLACVGLFGLAAFVTQQRTKEIGIRKVLGASVGGIFLHLSKEFTRLVGLAFVLAVPLAYLAMDRWLEGFAYRVDVGMVTFAVAGLLTLAMAWLTISYQSVKAALVNPVNSLRSE